MVGPRPSRRRRTGDRSHVARVSAHAGDGRCRSTWHAAGVPLSTVTGEAVRNGVRGLFTVRRNTGPASGPLNHNNVGAIERYRRSP